MPIDHVLIAVADPRATAGRLRSHHGLTAVEGGRHPAWGTANWIVPLGTSYLELLFVVDPLVAAANRFGRRVGEVAAMGGGPFAWCVAPIDFEATIVRLGLDPAPGTRHRPDGRILSWRTAGLEVALDDPSRPFFIEWQAAGTDHPGRRPSRSADPVSLERLGVAGDRASMAAWLGDEALPVVVTAGRPAIAQVVIETADGVRVLGAADWA
jgi:hypothetical protein